jgi:hypothetical protein
MGMTFGSLTDLPLACACDSRGSYAVMESFIVPYK